jgi:ADP-ribosylglycohydrolase
LQRIISHVDVIERRHDVKDTLISQRLKKVLVTFSDATELRKTVGCGFHAVETAAFAIGTFLRHLTDFHTGVLEAVNAGGDTDTNASVVGALIGANTGLDAIPLEWRRAHPSFSEALELGEKLCFE